MTLIERPSHGFYEIITYHNGLNNKKKRILSRVFEVECILVCKLRVIVIYIVYFILTVYSDLGWTHKNYRFIACV